jgi:hypothetical protein
MKKLEDIPKNNPFSVPDGYFDRLPRMIQARVAKGAAEKQARPYFRYALQYALPVVALIIVSVIYLTPKESENYNDILASVSTEQLAAYLSDSDITTDDILESGELDEESAEAIEAEVYFNDIDLEDLNEFDL